MSLARASSEPGDRADSIDAVKRQDVIEFAKRPWQLLADSGPDYWSTRKRELGPAEGLRIATELRSLVAAQRPDWPRAEERAADLETHAWVAECLRRVRRPIAP